MSILGYSSAYFLPQYWANTPLYGEKIIPLLDYILSTDYQYTDKLASAFYDIESKYKNTADLPIDKIEAIIEESGYGYVRDLLGKDEDSIRLLVYLLVLINELKGSKKGIETVLNLLKTKESDLELHIIGNLNVDTTTQEASNFSDKNYASYSNFTVGTNPFEFVFNIKTSDSFDADQCIVSSPNYGFYLGIDLEGKLVLRVGEAQGSVRTWQVINNKTSNTSTKALLSSTEYYIKFSFSGAGYDVAVSTDGSTYSNFMSLESSIGLNINEGTLLLGIDGSVGNLRSPYSGTIKLGLLSVSASNVIVTQWFETFPVDIEDTYSVEADIDVNLMSSDFFVKFAKFAERYVYPSLKAFRAKMALKSKITFLPWVRHKVTYISTNLQASGYERFNVVKDDGSSLTENYNVQPQSPTLYAWEYNDKLAYTDTTNITPTTKLYNRDFSLYEGAGFRIMVTSIGSYVVYDGRRANRYPSGDITNPVTSFLTRIIEEPD